MLINDEEYQISGQVDDSMLSNGERENEEAESFDTITTHTTYLTVIQIIKILETPNILKLRFK